LFDSAIISAIKTPKYTVPYFQFRTLGSWHRTGWYNIWAVCLHSGGTLVIFPVTVADFFIFLSVPPREKCDNIMTV